MATEKKTGIFKSFDGTEIYYEVRGSGKPLVMVYGIACLINHWRHQIKYFSENYQTIVFDLRGHHKSEKPENLENLDMESLAKDIDCLMKELQLEKASFWGHSFGVPVLLKTYEMFPHYFANMVFVNGFSKNPTSDIFGMDFVSPLFQVFKDKFEQSPQLWNSLWKKAVNNPVAVQLSAILGGFNLKLTSLKDIEIYAKGVAEMNLDVFIRMFDELVQYDAESVLEKVKTPTLIISGEKDLVTRQQFQKTLHTAIADSEYLMVPYGSHCSHLDFPEFVNLRIEKFLKTSNY